MNLRAKFHLASACLILTVVVGVLGSLIVSEKKRLLEEMAREQRDDLDKLARVCEEALIVNPNEPALLNYVINLVNLSAPRVAYAGVIYNAADRKQSWLFSSTKGLSFVSNEDPVARDIQRTTGPTMRSVNFAGTAVSELSKPVSTLGYVRLGYSRGVVGQIFRQTVYRMAMRFSVIGLIAIVIGLVLASIFSRALSQPIARLMHATEAIAQGKKGVKIAVSSRDELGRLTTTFNHMSEELAKLDEMKDDFMSHVTHELRSPLTSIIATVELLAEMPVTASDPKIKRSVDRLLYGSERLNKLVDNILDLMRLEAGKMSFDIQPIDIGKILHEMADFFEPRAADKGLTIRSVLPAETLTVLADAERIRQVLSNLIYNAIKFTNRGGIVLSVKTTPGFAQIAVADTGVGIPADKIDRLFQKFETLKDTRDRVENPVSGSGLGLNIVQNSVKAQGGKIWVESEVDKGSVFYFTLPLGPHLLSALKPPAAVNVTRDGAPVTAALRFEKKEKRG